MRKPGGYADKADLAKAIDCNYRIGEALESILDVNASEGTRRLLVARAALALNEQLKALMSMQKIREEER